MQQWHSSPVVDVLAAEQVTDLLAGAKKQALRAIDGWRGKHTGYQSESAPSSQEPSSPLQPDPGRADSHDSSSLPQSGLDRADSHQHASTSDRQAAAIARNVHDRLPKRAQQLLQVFSQQVLTSARKGPLASVLFPNQCVVRKTLAELSAFQLPNQTNRLALMFDPMDNEVPFTFGVEIFENGHKTNPHTHAVSHELFFILAGEGTGFCDNERFPVTAGDVVVFPPTSLHGIDNSESSKMYCLELMLPNDMFAEFVRQGQPAGKLRAEDMCILLAQGCASS